MDVTPTAVATAIALRHVLTASIDEDVAFDCLHALVPLTLEDALPIETGHAFIQTLVDHLAEHDRKQIDPINDALIDLRIEGADTLMNTLLDLRRIVGERSEEATIIDKRSPVGLFIRRLCVAYLKLPYHGVLALVRDFARWLEPPDAADDSEMSELKAGIFSATEGGLPAEVRWRAVADTDDDSLPTRLDTFEQLETHIRSGEHIGAHETLRRFMDYRFGTWPRIRPPPGVRALPAKPKERPLHQHALLNLSLLLYEEGGFIEARKSLQEAIRISRQVVDKDCLAACVSLSRRIEQEDPPPEPELHNEPDKLPASATAPAPPTTASDARHRTALDELWFVERGLHQGVPINSLFGNLLRAKTAGHRETVVAGLGEPTSGRITWDAAAWHTLASQLWSMAGYPQLATFHRYLALEQEPQGDVRLAVLSSIAESLALSGDLEKALHTLLKEDEVARASRMSVREVARWQSAVYGLLRMHAERGGYTTLREQLDRLSPPPPFGSAPPRLNPTSVLSTWSTQPLETPLDSTLSALVYAHELMKRASSLLDAHDTVGALQPILDALARTAPPSDASDAHGAHGQGLALLHLRARMLLVRWCIDAGEPSKGLAELERGPMPVEEAVERMEDIGLQALAARCRGRLEVALAPSFAVDPERRRRSLLKAAEAFAASAKDFERAGCFPLWQRSLSDLAVVYAELGDTVQRDATAARWRASGQGRKQTETKLLKQLEVVQRTLVRVSVDAALPSSE